VVYTILDIILQLMLQVKSQLPLLHTIRTKSTKDWQNLVVLGAGFEFVRRYIVRWA
jgi:hypothetical protein